MNTLVLLAHPRKDSFNGALASAYATAARRTGAHVRELHLADLSFALSADPRQVEEDEPDVLAAREAVGWADHLVIFTPIWWSTYTALLKGFLDRVFVSGFAFRYLEGKQMPERLLCGKTARVFATMDAPVFFHVLFYGDPLRRALVRPVLAFCGIRCLGLTQFGQIRYSDPARRAKMLGKVAGLAGRDAKQGGAVGGQESPA